MPLSSSSSAVLAEAGTSVQAQSVCDRCSLCYDPFFGCTTLYDQSTCVYPDQTWCANYANSQQAISQPSSATSPVCSECSTCYYEQPGFSVCDSRFTSSTCGLYGFTWCGAGATTAPTAPAPVINTGPSAGCSNCTTCWDSKANTCVASTNIAQCSQLGQVWCGDARKLCGSCNGCLDSATKTCRASTVDTCSRTADVWCMPLTTWIPPSDLVLNYNDWYNSHTWGPRPAPLPRACEWPPTDPTCFTDPFVKASNQWVHLPAPPKPSSSFVATDAVLVAEEPALSVAGSTCRVDERYIGIPKPSWWGVGNWPPLTCTWNVLALPETQQHNTMPLQVLVVVGAVVIMVVAIVRSKKRADASKTDDLQDEDNALDLPLLW